MERDGDFWTRYNNENARKAVSSKYEQKLYWNALFQEYNTLLN